MKVLLAHRYFWPDSPPYASMLRSIAESLSEDGHDVDVFTAQPSYGSSALHERRDRRESFGQIRVTRAALLPESKAQTMRRVINLGLFAAQLAIHILRQRPAAVMVGTTPPIVVSTAATMAARLVRARSVYHCQDIYPEVALTTGALRSGEQVAGLLRRLDGATMRRTDRVVVLSEDMRNTAETRGVARSKIEVINNFAPDEGHSSADDWRPSLDRNDRRRVIFAGNLGNFQDLDTVIAAAVLLADQPIEFVFLGDGAARERLETAASDLVDRTVRFEGRVGQASALRAVRESDVALVTLAPRVINAAYPSKTLTYLEAGTPVLAAVEPHSELAVAIIGNQLGAAVRPGDPEAMAAAVVELLDSDLPAMRSRCRSFAATLSRDVQLESWQSLFRELAR